MKTGARGFDPKEEKISLAFREERTAFTKKAPRERKFVPKRYASSGH